MARKLKNSLKVTVSQAGPAAVVTVVGSAGIEEAAELKARLESLADAKVSPIVVDVSNMDFICSSGLSAIISAHLKSRHHNGQIRLVNPQPAIREVLETTRLTKLFPLRDSVEEALKG